MAGNPRIYGALIPVVGKYSKFASAGEKAGVRQAIKSGATDNEPAASDEAPAGEGQSAQD